MKRAETSLISSTVLRLKLLAQRRANCNFTFFRQHGSRCGRDKNPFDEDAQFPEPVRYRNSIDTNRDE